MEASANREGEGANQTKVEDDILDVVKAFIAYLEKVDREEKNDNRI